MFRLVYSSFVRRGFDSVISLFVDGVVVGFGVFFGIRGLGRVVRGYISFVGGVVLLFGY